mgnify:CR=1 FL=1
MGKYLLFDADGTLYDFNATESIALKDIFRYYRIPYTEANISIYHECNDFCWDQFEKGLMNQEKLKGYRFRLFFDRLGLSISDNEAGNLFLRMLSKHGIMLPGAVDFLNSIEDRRKAIITNGIAEVQHGRIDGSNTRGYFERIFISEEIGSNKPDPAFFHTVLNALRLSPEECIVIGDSEKSDIQGAINAGIESIYINFRGMKSDKATYSVSSFDELKRLIDSI